jgi:hypothetical protein
MSASSPPPDSVPKPHYAVQLAFVRAMLPVLGGLLEAGSEVDEVVQREIESLPEDLVFGMTVFGTDAKIRLTRRGTRFVQLDPKTAPEPTLDIVFKHVAIAFLVVSFQESTALAFARGRMVVHGDTGLAMRITRCLDRMEAVTLPGPIAERALKSVPHIAMAERLPLAARYYAKAAQNAARGRV